MKQAAKRTTHQQAYLDWAQPAHCVDMDRATSTPIKIQDYVPRLAH